MKIRCAICEQAKGKQTCLIHHNAMICPPCCATSRNEDCQGCPHYAMAHHHPAVRARVKPFIIEVDPVVESEVTRAVSLLDGGNIQAGKAIILRLMLSHPDNHQVVYARGLCHIQEGQIGEGIAAFEAAIQLYPYFEEAYYNLGVAYQKQGNIPKLVAAFRKTIEVGDPHDVFVKTATTHLQFVEQLVFNRYRFSLDTYMKSSQLFDLGFDAMRHNNWEEAIGHFKASLAIADDHPQCYGNIGICHAYLGRKSEALQALDLALKIDPGYELATVNMRIIERLDEGEKLPSEKLGFTEYYKDYTFQNRSYIKERFNEREVGGSDQEL